MTTLEDWQVLALRDCDNKRLAFALICKMMLELHPQYASLRPDDIVVIRAIAGRSAVDVNPDLLLCRLFGFVFESATTDVEKECTESRRLLEGDARRNSANKILSGSRNFIG